ncbi:hypothetical protein [Cryptosporangium aurantiacum]|uniref:Uncharacterized protein n=1 Tax=Cryptosporangium aurantiacum TaxID=134849 RepID=A0A1M7RFW5_9ACTN|nr:hypothetical protein [Cryptosporangium aurantiacum]SHN45051.1 hypothetical protein SAMN05443668_11187 [Cryptosporangium aurantiacum]
MSIERRLPDRPAGASEPGKVRAKIVGLETFRETGSLQATSTPPPEPPPDLGNAESAGYRG